MSYCSAIESMQPAERKALHKRYHDTLYGFPIHDDNELFGRLILEINQAGLSWETILKKEDAFRNAYAGFDIAKVASFDAALPGSQPQFQIATLLPALRAAIALNCDVQRKSGWDRKHYFHWDQPNGYQITQYYGR